MNLHFTITSYPPAIGGAQLHTALLARRLAVQNTVGVISLWDSNRTDWLLGTTLRAHSANAGYLEAGVPVNRLGFSTAEKLRMAPFVAGYYFWMGLAIPAIAGVIEQKLWPLTRSAEVIHNVRIGREPLSFASYNTAKKRGIPFVFTPLHHPRWSGWLHRHYQALYRKADALIALTEVEKKYLAEMGVDERRIFTTGIGPIVAEEANPDRFRKTHRISGKPLVLFLGQKYEYKGVRVLLEAARAVWERLPDTVFAFIGPRTDYSKALFAQVADERILELDAVDLQTKTDALAACDVLCVPSSQESFGGVYTEAWSFAKPVMGCRIPAVAEVIEHGVNGLLTAQAPDEIADGLIQLLGDSALALRLGEAGKCKVEARFTWEKLANLTYDAYQTTLEIG